MATTFPVRAETAPAIRDIDALIAALRKTGKEAGMTEKEIDDLVNKTGKFGKEGAKGVAEINTGMSGLNKTITTVGATLATVFAVDRLKAFVGQVLSVTSEFQRLEAVLTNTLGSKSEAQAAILAIQKMASSTPFSVRELTENFVKLANRGVKPTIEEMRKMGDVAATLGKPFEQVVEAILDISNSERWREIGIQSEKMGDKVKLSFRGVTQVVEGTVEGVAGAIAKFGEMNGVMGAMDSISKTLGGSMSNLGDIYEQVLTRIGNKNTGLIKGFIDLAAEMLNIINISMSDPIGEQALKNAETYRGSLENAFKTFKETGNSSDINQALADNVRFTNEWRASVAQLEEALKGMSVARGFTMQEIQATKIQLDVERQTLQLLTEMTQDYMAKVRDAGVQTKTLTEEQLAWLEKLKTATFELSGQDEKFISVYKMMNQEAAELKKTIEDLLKVVGMSTTQTGNILDGFTPDTESVDVIPGLKSVEDLKNSEDLKRSIRQETYNQAVALAESYMNLQRRQADMELQWLQYRYSEEIKLAGDNNAAKEKIGADYARKERELQNKQVQQQQQLALFNILSQQGPALAKTIGQAGFPAALPLMFLVAAQFALLTQSQRGIRPPRFKDGVYGLDGPGTETSDSIPAWLSRNESVVPAERSRQFKEILKPLIENEQFAWADVKRIVDGKLPGLAPAIVISQGGTDSNDLVEEMRATRRAIERKRETRINMDENGFGVYLGTKDQWTKYVTKRYSMP